MNSDHASWTIVVWLCKVWMSWSNLKVVWIKSVTQNDLVGWHTGLEQPYHCFDHYFAPYVLVCERKLSIPRSHLLLNKGPIRRQTGISVTYYEVVLIASDASLWRGKVENVASDAQNKMPIWIIPFIEYIKQMDSETENHWVSHNSSEINQFSSFFIPPPHTHTIPHGAASF